MQIRVGDYVALSRPIPRFGRAPLARLSRGFVVRGNADGWYRVEIDNSNVEVFGDELILLVKGEDNS